jgi:hypothetical protein
VTGKESGATATQGGLFGGWALYFELGKHRLVMDFVDDGGGMGKAGTSP